MYAISESRNYRLIVDYDDSINADPRDYENLGTLICFHKRYLLGDNHKFHSINDFLFSLLDEIYPTELRFKNAVSKCTSVNGLIELASKNHVILPVYLLDHSGLWMQTYPFTGHEFDSGLLGFIYVSYQSIRNCFSIKRITGKHIETVKQLLISEVEEYSNYVAGNIFYYKLIDKSTCCEIDSCYGIIAGNLEEIKEILIPLLNKEHEELVYKLDYFNKVVIYS